MKTNNALMVGSLALVLAGCGVIGGSPDGGGGRDMGGADMAGAGVEAKLSSLYSNYLTECKVCHAPNAPGRTSDTEKTLDFTSAATAFTTLTTGKAAGLVGNQMSCNGASFVVAGKPEESLLVAVLDESTRMAFSKNGCTKDNVTDMTIKVGQAPSAAFTTALKAWITAGASNN